MERDEYEALVALVKQWSEDPETKDRPTVVMMGQLIEEVEKHKTTAAVQGKVIEKARHWLGVLLHGTFKQNVPDNSSLAEIVNAVVYYAHERLKQIHALEGEAGEYAKTKTYLAILAKLLLAPPPLLENPDSHLVLGITKKVEQILKDKEAAEEDAHETNALYSAAQQIQQECDDRLRTALLHSTIAPTPTSSTSLAEEASHTLVKLSLAIKRVKALADSLRPNQTGKFIAQAIDDAIAGKPS